MKKIISFLLIGVFSMFFSGCTSNNNTATTPSTEPQATLNATQPTSAIETEAETKATEKTTDSLETEAVTTIQEDVFTEVAPAEKQEAESNEDSSTTDITVTIGNESFSAKLYNNQTTKELLALFPLKLTMEELNGNEKFFNFSNSFTTDTISPSYINSGDIMLYGSTYLVLFYDSFSTTYDYTRLGYIENPENLKSAVGSGSVQVTFSKN